MISKQTTLDLNGPILSFLQQPQSISICDGGSATFVGIATASFPIQDPPNPASNSGFLSYRWYAEGFGPLSDGVFQNLTITGTATTTLTITNAKSPISNGLRFYVGVDYIPSAYSQPVGSAFTVGTGRSTGNAINEVLNSNSATLTVFPTISVIQQPTEQTAAQTRTATFTTLGALSDNTQGNISYQWQLNGNDLSDSSTVSGSGTTSLSISLPNIGINTVRARLTHPTSCSSPLFTNTVNFNVVNNRQIINIETFEEGGSSQASLRSINLFTDGSVTLAANTTIGLTSLYASESDLDVILELYGARGSDSGSYRGGQGGVSVVRLTMKRNEEYVITRLPQNTGTGGIFIYRKSRLILVCGSGGNAGVDGNGGDGGGVNVAGANGSGRGAGTGGILYLPGTLPSIGVFGSSVSVQPTYSGDTIASVPNGGRVLPCPRGEWTRTGYSPCQDLGFVQFYRADGSIVSNTARIDRGFKAGYGIRNTAGAGVSRGGQGGGGATGGQGGTGGGGGGGSGYFDGSSTIISTQQGGHNGLATVIIRSAT